MGTRVGSIPLLIFMAALLIYPAVERKIQAGIWHLWNGTTIRFQEYEIPVPTNWVAQTLYREDGTLMNVALFDVKTSFWRGQLHPTIVFLKTFALKGEVKDRAGKFHDEFLKSIDAQVFDRRTVDISGDQADCEASNELVSQLSVPSDSIITISCKSTDGLEIISSGDQQNIDIFYSIVSQIRKHN